MLSIIEKSNRLSWVLPIPTSTPMADINKWWWRLPKINLEWDLRLLFKTSFQATLPIKVGQQNKKLYFILDKWLSRFHWENLVIYSPVGSSKWEVLPRSYWKNLETEKDLGGEDRGHQGWLGHLTGVNGRRSMPYRISRCWGVTGICLHYKTEVLTRHLTENGDIYPCFSTTLNRFQFFILMIGTVIHSVV